MIPSQAAVCTTQLVIGKTIGVVTADLSHCDMGFATINRTELQTSNHWFSEDLTLSMHVDMTICQAGLLTDHTMASS